VEFHPSAGGCGCRLDFNEPPTAVGGIPSISGGRGCRLDFNEPPTPVGGVHPSWLELGHDTAQ